MMTGGRPTTIVMGSAWATRKRDAIEYFLGYGLIFDLEPA
jgi:hypothetical protein